MLQTPFSLWMVPFFFVTTMDGTFDTSRKLLDLNLIISTNLAHIDLLHEPIRQLFYIKSIDTY